MCTYISEQASCLYFGCGFFSNLYLLYVMGTFTLEFLGHQLHSQITCPFLLYKRQNNRVLRKLQGKKEKQSRQVLLSVIACSTRDTGQTCRPCGWFPGCIIFHRFFTISGYDIRVWVSMGISNSGRDFLYFLLLFWLLSYNYIGKCIHFTT